MQNSPVSSGSQESLQQRNMRFHPQMLQISYSPSPTPSGSNLQANSMNSNAPNVAGDSTPGTKKKSRLGSLSRIFKRSSMKTSIISSPIQPNDRTLNYNSDLTNTRLANPMSGGYPAPSFRNAPESLDDRTKSESDNISITELYFVRSLHDVLIYK